jgi:hypothetical protein
VSRNNSMEPLPRAFAAARQITGTTEQSTLSDPSVANVSTT